MKGETTRQRDAQLQQELDHLFRMEQDVGAKMEATMARLEAEQNTISSAEFEVAKKELNASAAFTREHFQELRADIERRSNRGPAVGRRAELRHALEDLDHAERRLEAGFERQKARVLSMEPGPLPPAEFEAGIARMMVDLDAAGVQARAHFAEMRAEIERELKDGADPE